MRFGRYVLHVAIATVGGLIFAFFGSSVFSGGAVFNEPVWSAAIIGGAVLGFLVNRRFRDGYAALAWVIPLVWVVYGVFDEAHHFSHAWSQQTLLGDLWDNFFGADCGGSECLYELLFSAPFLSSLAYSLSALLVLRSKSFNKEEEARTS